MEFFNSRRDRNDFLHYLAAKLGGDQPCAGTGDEDAVDAVLNFGDREVRLSNLKKSFWKKLGITKRDLLQYYADVSPYLLPHVAGRAMVREEIAKRPELKKATYRIPHYGVAGTAANLVLHIAATKSA